MLTSNAHKIKMNFWNKVIYFIKIKQFTFVLMISYNLQFCDLPLRTNCNSRRMEFTLCVFFSITLDHYISSSSAIEVTHIQKT